MQPKVGKEEGGDPRVWALNNRHPGPPLVAVARGLHLKTQPRAMVRSTKGCGLRNSPSLCNLSRGQRLALSVCRISNDEITLFHVGAKKYQGA